MGNSIDDFDERGDIPNNVPLGLILALRQKSALKVKEAISFASLEDLKKGAQRAPSHSIIGLLKMLGLKSNNDGIYEDFLGKNVCDIGGGIAGTAPTLSNSVGKLIVIDPIYLEPDFDGLLEKQFLSQEDSVIKNTKFIVDNPISIPGKYDVLEMKKVNQEMTQVKKDMEWWKDKYSKEKYPQIEKNSSYGEDLVGVGNESQDYVFLNFVITKATVSYTLVINEINRVLKQGGKMLLSDNFMSDDILEYLKEYFTLQIVENSSKRFVALCTKK